MSGAQGCVHEWVYVAPVVRVVGEPHPEAYPHGTYNSQCVKCGEKAWTHWPPLRRQEPRRL
jgi:hypothetical protein